MPYKVGLALANCIEDWRSDKIGADAQINRQPCKKNLPYSLAFSTSIKLCCMPLWLL